MWRIRNLGKNLFPYSTWKDYINAYTVDVNQYYYIQGRYLWATSNGSSQSKVPVLFLKAGTYTIRVKVAALPAGAIAKCEIKTTDNDSILGVYMTSTGIYTNTFTVTTEQISKGVHIKLFCLEQNKWAAFEYVQIIEGSSAPAEYSPPLNQSLESSTNLWGYAGVYDEITSDGLVVKRWKKINIDWTNWGTTSFKGRVSDDSGWRVVLKRLTSQVAKRMSEIVAVKYDGVPLKYVGGETKTSSKDQVAWGSQEYYYVVSISDADSGWNSSYEPSSEDIKRYFNGWKYVDGTTWQGIGSSATADATTALNYTVKDIDPDADWKPYVVIYQLAEPEYYQALVNGELYVAPETNYIILPNNAFAVIELETDTQNALDSIFRR